MRKPCAAQPVPATEDLRRTAETSSRVRFLRARRAVGSQEAVARTIGISVDSVQLWERGKVRVPAWALVLVEELAAAHVVRPKRISTQPITGDRSEGLSVDCKDASGSKPSIASGMRAVLIDSLGLIVGEATEAA